MFLEDESEENNRARAVLAFMLGRELRHMIVATNLGPWELMGNYGIHDFITVALSGG